MEIIHKKQEKTLLYSGKCGTLKKENYALGGLRSLGKIHALLCTAKMRMRRVMYEKTR